MLHNNNSEGARGLTHEPHLHTRLTHTPLYKCVCVCSARTVDYPDYEICMHSNDNQNRFRLTFLKANEKR